LIDWPLFARELGPDFFAMIAHSGKADMLIGEPPRIYYRDGGMRPVKPEPIADVEQLMIRGVGQVRNNIVHGEKYVDRGSKRDDDLVMQAMWVLEQAVEWHPAARNKAAASAEP
jgi:hypothetical protein